MSESFYREYVECHPIFGCCRVVAVCCFACVLSLLLVKINLKMTPGGVTKCSNIAHSHHTTVTKNRKNLHTDTSTLKGF